ncbi:MAG: shikimate kinase [Rhodothermales bacterium]
MAAPTRIYLTGFMGTGKSTIGSIGANVLGYDFADLDTLIERAAQSSISVYFQTHGEAAFRTLEREQLEGTAALANHVIALGGGALTSEYNLNATLRLGTVIYLKASVEALMQRLWRGRVRRPMLQDEYGVPLKMGPLRERITTLLAAREPFYSRAHITIETDGLSLGQTVDAFVHAVRLWH